MHVEIWAREVVPLFLPRLDVGVPGFQRIAALGAAPVDLGKDLAQERARIRENAEIGRIVAAKLGWVDVDVDQLAVREIPRIARHPRRGRAVVETRADRDHYVGVAASFVGGIRAVAADEA